MRFCKFGISPDIIIPEDKYLTLVIEHKDFLYKFLSELYSLIYKPSNNDSSISLLIDNSPVSIDKSVLCFFNLIDFDFNSKQILTLLQKKFSSFLLEQDSINQRAVIESDLLRLFDDFKLCSGLNIVSGYSISDANLFKLASFRICEDEISLLDKICSYIDLMLELSSVRLIIFVFAKAFLSDDDIKLLFKHCIDSGCRMLLIENFNQKNSNEHESLYIIDCDLCSIV